MRKPVLTPEQLLRQRLAQLTEGQAIAIAEHFSLVPAAHQGVATEFLHAGNSRWLAFSMDHPLYKSYRLLEEHRLPILQAVETKEGLMLIEIPLHARPVSRYMSTTRNLEEFRSILNTVGRVLRRASTTPPAGAQHDQQTGPILHQFAYASSKDNQDEGLLFMTPPYTVSGLPAEAIFPHIQQELQTIGFSPQDAYDLTGVVYDGWKEA